MIRRFITLTLGIGLCTAALLALGCEAKSKVVWHETGQPLHVRGGQSWWHYQYVYYPGTQVYFEPYTKHWYWFQDDLWLTGTELPAQLKPANVRSGRVVFLNERRPWDQHGTVVAYYPPDDPMLQDRHNALLDQQPDWRMAQYQD